MKCYFFFSCGLTWFLLTNATASTTGGNEEIFVSSNVVDHSNKKGNRRDIQTFYRQANSSNSREDSVLGSTVFESFKNPLELPYSSPQADLEKTEKKSKQILEDGTIYQDIGKTKEEEERDLFIDLYERRRAYVTDKLYNALQGTVNAGPFQGLKLVKPEHKQREIHQNKGKESNEYTDGSTDQPVVRWGWGDFDMASKLLGFYEDELYPYVEEVINVWKPDHVLNVGCADGFYGIGMARRLQSLSKVYLVDIVDDFLKLAIENVLVNDNVNINNLQFWKQNQNENLIPKLLKDAKTPFLLVDCEGCELEYLPSPNLLSDVSNPLTNFPIEAQSKDNLDDETLIIASILKRSIILVEIHDFVTDGIGETLVERFKDSHDITMIRQGAKDPYKSSIIRMLHDMDKWMIINENRPETMFWLYMIPKSFIQ